MPREYPPQYCERCERSYTHAVYYRQHHAGRCQRGNQQGEAAADPDLAPMEIDGDAAEAQSEGSNESEDDEGEGFSSNRSDSSGEYTVGAQEGS